MKTTLMKAFFFALMFPIFSGTFAGNDPQMKKKDPRREKTYYTQKIETKAPVIDGSFDDVVWNNVPWTSGFTQREPNDGAEPSQQTAFKILYDDNNLYIAIKAFDTEPEKIVRRMSARDGFDGDFVEVNIDSYDDDRTAFSFTASVSGVKSDEAVTNNGDSWDSSWDAIWYLKTAVVADGWNAEIRIPFSQLRFSDKEKQNWGLQVTRRLFRKEERSNWQYIPQNEAGWVHHFGHLQGIEGIKPKRQIDVSPYVVAKAERFEKEAGNPYADGSLNDLTVGVDGKIGITNDLTLDFTINPDFGQVEADPSEVNLTAFESYFQEKRPFFIEGRNITSFGLSMGDGGFALDNLFYSRRIGRSPQYYPDLADNEYANVPSSTRILGAAKLTGKTQKGWSVGILETVTAEEKAEIYNEGQTHNEVVEPLTNYSLMRVSKDLNDGNTVIGAMLTSTNRKIDVEHLNFLPDNAFSGGLDLQHYWNDKKYFLNTNFAYSDVRGSTQAIDELQLASARYFQRPDAEHVTYDMNKTHLQGHGGNIAIGKNGSSGLRYASFITWRSPGLELNDMGYVREADYLLQVFWAGYRITTPFSVFRTANINLNQWSVWDFGSTNLNNGGNINSSFQFTNQWSFGFGINRDGDGFSNTALRGGEAMKTEGSMNYWVYMNTDNRKKIRFTFGGSYNIGDFNSSKHQSVWGSVTYRPVNTFNIALYPEYSISNNTLQYVDNFRNAQDEDRYLFATINRKTLSLTIRANFNMTPDLSIQYYGSPFISTGKYSDYKYVTSPKAEDYANRYELIDQSLITYSSDNEVYSIDENNDGAPDYELDEPDFNFKQFRSNLVLRWEYVPGSALYVVWSQGITDYESNGRFDLNENLNQLTDTQPYNVFLLKFSYRLQL